MAPARADHQRQALILGAEAKNKPNAAEGGTGQRDTASQERKPIIVPSYFISLFDNSALIRGAFAPGRQCPMNCRPYCAACCIAPSISTPIPGMPDGKPAGVPCVQLDEQLGCRLFGQPSRPAVCASLQPHLSMCGDNAAQAMHTLKRLEILTRPG